MTLADERLRELDNPLLTDKERVVLRCKVAADLIHKGQYEAAREALGELWRGVGQRSPMEDYPPEVRAEVLLQCGTLTRWFGNAQNLPGAQEQAKDMLSEAAREFEAQGVPRKVAECRYELGMCYWWLGAHDEARVVMREALTLLGDEDVELKAKIHIRRTIVEVWAGRYYEAIGILEESKAVFLSANDALKGRWHGQMAMVLDKLATAEENPANYDRAIIEYTAAIYHYEAARHERYCAINLNNLAMLFYKIGRYVDAHEHLDRAQAILTRLKDTGTLAQVDETRAQVLVAEKRYRDADRILAGVIKAFEVGGEQALLAEAFMLQGIIWARLRAVDNSLTIIRKAIEIAEHAGAPAQAGHAALTLIEEHGTTRRMPTQDVVDAYRRAIEYLKDTQDAEDVKRLLACSLIVMSRFDAQVHDPGFTFESAVYALEARLIEQALDLEAGNVSRAAKRLGLKRQTLSNMLHTRHRQLVGKRTPLIPRLKSIIKKDS
ncbi:MAG TPA: helix-turn-helix domain-containing protein [Pyrinomonadaceae bacterium]|nr:helix-turn-helix domain-containing protein [Pyrinomonadaceae bacterium]